MQANVKSNRRDCLSTYPCLSDPLRKEKNLLMLRCSDRILPKGKDSIRHARRGLHPHPIPLPWRERDSTALLYAGSAVLRFSLVPDADIGIVWNLAIVFIIETGKSGLVVLGRLHSSPADLKSHSALPASSLPPNIVQPGC